MGSGQPFVVNVQGSQCSETADLCGNGCQTVGMEASNRRARMASVCSNPWGMFRYLSAVRLQISRGRDSSLL